MIRHLFFDRLFKFFIAAMLAAVLSISMANKAHADLPDMPDPVHVQLDKTDPPPMDDLRQLAKQGDTRAMFILGDMYEKEKGGLKKNWPKARKWFEDAGRHGMNYAFIRLAAMAKHDHHPKEAWQWYTLAIQGFNDTDGDEDASATQEYVIEARENLVKTARLSYQDITDARRAMADWKDKGDGAAPKSGFAPNDTFKLNQ